MMRTKTYLALIILLFIFALAACKEKGAATSVGDTPTIIKIDPNSTQVQDDSFVVTSYSKYIAIHKDGKELRVDYNFLPEGTDVCQQVTYDADTNPNGCLTANTIVIPCQYQSIGDDLLNFNINAPIEEADCANQIVVDMSTAKFELGGLVFPFASSLDIFIKDFEFKITTQGFKDSSNDNLINFDNDDVDLDDVYTTIMTDRTS